MRIEPAFDLLPPAASTTVTAVTGVGGSPPRPRPPPPPTQAFCSCIGIAIRAPMPPDRRSPSGTSCTSREVRLARLGVADDDVQLDLRTLGRRALAAHRGRDAVDVLGDRLDVVGGSGSGGITGMPGFCRPFLTTGRISSPC